MMFLNQVDSLDEEEKVRRNVSTLGGVQETWLITEDGVYEILMQSRKPIAKEFKKQVKDILKTIRKTGGYVQENRAIDFVNNWLPSLDDNSKNAIASVIEENRKLILKIEEQKPKVEFTDKLLKSKDCILVRDFAKILYEEKINIGEKNYING
jgi:anti-repressor protein